MPLLSLIGNVLVVVIGQQGLNVRDEIRHISELRQSTVLYDPTVKEIYEACKIKYQVVYFGCHSVNSELILTNSEKLNRSDVAQIVRLCHAECVFFSACETQEIAAYLVQHGTHFCIRTNSLISDADSWKMVIAFFRSLYDGARGDVGGGGYGGDTSEGKYGLDVSPDLLIALMKELRDFKERLGVGKVVVSVRAGIITLVLFVATLCIILLTAYALSGGHS